MYVIVLLEVNGVGDGDGDGDGEHVVEVKTSLAFRAALFTIKVSHALLLWRVYQQEVVLPILQRFFFC